MTVTWGAQEERYAPAAHILMTQRTAAAYERAMDLVFTVIKDQTGVMEIVMDFETALWDGVGLATRRHIKGRTVVLHGCLFHFSQAVVRMFKRKVSDPTPDQRRVMRYLLFAPYMRKEAVSAFITELLKRKTGMEAFIQYFAQFWMKKRDMWLVNNVVSDILTNCALESYHGKLNQAIPYPHPQLRTVSETLLHLDHRIISINAGNEEFGEYRQRAERRQTEFQRRFPSLTSEAGELLDRFPELATQAQGTTPELEDMMPARDPEIDVANYIERLFAQKDPVSVK